ncbi:unnamed protein product [Hydatigera taeniaeformis]|uniref:COesterase domain-containing protein n=1 Tax=Hydatigena taeniaeformis TaxID=6205 RepID=A0A0R3X8T3_HYDTA|nr:unnamed protein product [Hydatigera taeniaeformis]
MSWTGLYPGIGPQAVLSSLPVEADAIGTNVWLFYGPDVRLCTALPTIFRATVEQAANKNDLNTEVQLMSITKIFIADINKFFAAFDTTNALALIF